MSAICGLQLECRANRCQMHETNFCPADWWATAIFGRGCITPFLRRRCLRRTSTPTSTRSAVPASFAAFQRPLRAYSTRLSDPRVVHRGCRRAKACRRHRRLQHRRDSRCRTQKERNERAPRLRRCLSPLARCRQRRPTEIRTLRPSRIRPRPPAGTLHQARL